MPLSFRQVRYFIATAEAGKVSLAGANLNVSQSAITAAIKSLERELGARLLRRHSNGMSLTYEGHQFLQHARNIEAAVSEATRSTWRSGDDVVGEIDVAVTYTVAGYFLPSILARFQRTFPGVTVRLHELPRDQIEPRIVTGELDLAVMLVSNLQNVAQIESEILFQSRRRLWACPDHHLLSKDSVTLADVAEESYIMLSVDEAAHTALRYWRTTSYRPKVVFETSSVEAVRSMVAIGMGVTVLSDMVYRPWSLEGQRIELRNLVDEVPTMDVGLASKRGAVLSAPAQAFHDYLTLAFSGSAPGWGVERYGLAV